MKTLKAAKRNALGNSRKSASRMTHTVVRSRNGSRRIVRSRDRRPLRPTLHARAKAGHKGISPTDPEKQRIDVQYQSAVRNFETAVRALQKQNYDKAAEIFEKLVNSEAREVAERARVHLRLCQQRTGRAAPAPRSAEEYYTLGVVCLNARNLELAVEHLSKANKLKPNQDHIRYALAAAHARQGNTDAAIEHLGAAVTLRPENRIQARHDKDFQGWPPIPASGVCSIRQVLKPPARTCHAELLARIRIP